MEDNIESMMKEIKTVVSHHIKDVKEKLNDTMDVLNTLPFVITLREQLDLVENENACLKQELDRLKKLLKKYNEKKNIQLEIIEVDPLSLEHKSPSDQFLDFPTEDVTDDSSLDDDSEIDDEFSSLPQAQGSGESETQAEDITIWGSIKETNELKDQSLLQPSQCMNVEKYGIKCVSFSDVGAQALYFIVKIGDQLYYSQNCTNGDLREDREGKVGIIVGRFENGIAFFS